MQNNKKVEELEYKRGRRSGKIKKQKKQMNKNVEEVDV